ncbi:hypothetical protein FHR85_002635 [Alkalibacillus almallahensis]|nr:hypothetical protein [Alkalibacillus almallahensis]
MAVITITLLLTLMIMIVVSVIKNKPFPRKMLIATMSCALLLGSTIIYERYFFTFEEINQAHVQDGPGPIDSPDDTYSANAYYEPYGGAAGGVNVWVEVVNHTNDDQTKIIYYSDAKQDFQMNWVGDETLEIENNAPRYQNQDRSVTLDVTSEIYHDRGDACRSWVLKQDYDDCYEMGL